MVKIAIDNNAQMGAYLALPSSKPRSGIVVLQEIFGVTPAMRAIADDFATEGYAALVPDIYWRLQPGLDLGNGEDPAQRDIAVDFSNRLDEATSAKDIAASLDWLAGHLGLQQRPGIIGFCLGGRLAVRTAFHSNVGCMVSMYGVKLEALAADIKQIRCPLQFHFGEHDNHNPMSTIRAIARTVEERCRSDDQFFTYPGAEHAFYNRYRLDRFNEAAHKLARSRVLAFLRSNLPRID
jgi:carboxymethylenebutenolidase